MGFKFNVATLIPIIFGLLALIAKKALVLSKIAMVVTSALGLGSLLLGGSGFNSRPPYLGATHGGLLNHQQHHGLLQHGAGLYYNR